MTEFRLERPSLIKCIHYAIDTAVYINSIIFSIVFRENFWNETKDETIQQFETYLIIDGLIFLLSIYHIWVWFRNMNRYFNSHWDLEEWKSNAFHLRLEKFLLIISMINRFSFIHIAWNPPKGFLIDRPNLYTAIFIVAIYTLGIIISIIGYFVYIQYRTYTPLLNLNQPQNLQDLQEQYRDNINIHSNSLFLGNYIENPNTDCSICLDNQESHEWIELLECHHQFHKDCIFQYIDSTNHEPTCPICRAPILKDIQQPQLV